jgi:hypothetical protein
MRYATLEQVRARVPRQLCALDAESQPDAATVTAWLEAASRWIDATLRWRYRVPVLHPADRELLAPACAALVAAQVWGVVAGGAGEAPAAAAALRREARELLAHDGRTGRAALVLPHTAPAAGGEAALTAPEATFTDPGDPEGLPRLFRMGQEF